MVAWRGRVGCWRMGHRYSASVNDFVQIVDVAPRDGLQSDAVMFSTDQKVELVRRITAAGVQRIEVASFVNPARVPQMADAEAVLAGLAALAGTGNRVNASYIGLVLNGRGFDRAVAANTPEVNVVVMCSDTFSQKNQSMSTRESLAAAIAVIGRANELAIPVSVTLSAAFGCPYEGEMAQSQVVEIAVAIAEANPSEIALADTIGAAVPRDVRTLVPATRDAIDAVDSSIVLRAHFHNTRNSGIANVLAAVESGVRVIDASLGGIGGCPFAPRATGNVATEDVVFMLERSGYTTGVSIPKLIEATDWLEAELGRSVPSLVAKAGSFPPG